MATPRSRCASPLLLLPLLQVILILISAVVSYSQTDIDFTTPHGFHTKASKQNWLKKVPPVLMFALQVRGNEKRCLGLHNVFIVSLFFCAAHFFRPRLQNVHQDEPQDRV